MWVPTADLPKSAGHPFYERLNRVLDDAGFDAFVEAQCASFYADGVGRPSLAPGRYFRLLLLGKTEVVLRNDRFDYNWQIGYEPAEPIALPRGSTLHVVGHHDNSARNRFNPNPDTDVYYGDQA